MTTKTISELTQVETEFFNMLYRARSVEFDIKSIVKKDFQKHGSSHLIPC